MNRKEWAGLRMRAVRRVYEHSQAHTARLLELSAPKLANWESGKHFPDHDALARLCENYAVPTDWVILGQTPGMDPDRAAQLRKALEVILEEDTLKRTDAKA